MPPESVADPAIDLDIYVYDPNGVQVASSTSGATNELVDILLPQDGTWSVFVHGWQTAGDLQQITTCTHGLYQPHLAAI